MLYRELEITFLSRRRALMTVFKCFGLRTNRYQGNQKSNGYVTADQSRIANHFGSEDDSKSMMEFLGHG